MIKSDMGKTGRYNINLLTFFFATAIVLYLYFPVLLPLANNELVFAYGDFSSIGGDNSASIRNSFNYYTFNKGEESKETNRAFLIESVSILSEMLRFSDSRTQSIIILASILLGSYGLYQIIKFFNKEKTGTPLLILTMIPFYFLNLWSIERIGHLWIWFTYAIFPLFLSLGLSYVLEKKSFFLVSYALLFAFFGMMPHSFIYLLTIHLFLIIFLLFYQINLKEILVFSFVPLIIYALLNLPALSLSLTTRIQYPVSVTVSDLQMLSRYGSLTNVLTLSNNWWPQIEPEKVLDNYIFRLTSLGVILIIWLLSIFTYNKTRRHDRILLSLSLLSILGLIFVAQGTNNELLRGFIGLLDYKTLQLFAPFREWGRIAILMPVFLMLVVAICIPKLRKKEKEIFLTLMVSIVWINVLSSPIFEYLNTVHSATNIPEEYYELSVSTLKEHKTIWIMPSKARLILDTYRYSWNEDKALGNSITACIGSPYPHQNVIKLIKSKEAPKKLLDSLNIRYIIKRTDILDADDFEVNYDWLDCEELEYLTICENKDSIKPFSIYNGTILVGDNAERLYSLSAITNENFAPSEDYGDFSSFVLVDNYLYETQDGIEDKLEGRRIIYILEAETDFHLENSTSKKEPKTNASCGESVSFIQNGTALKRLDIIKEGYYRLALKGKGNFEIEIGNKTFSLNPNFYEYSYSELFYFPKGYEKLKITASENSSLDVVWIYSTDEMVSLEEIFDVPESPARIKKFTRINPTLWNVDIKATEPFLLSFAETYDPLWEARIYENYEKKEIIKPIRLYGIMNGYWINQTGDLKVEVRYAPQDTFELTMLVSVATFFFCIIYLLYPSIAKRKHNT